MFWFLFVIVLFFIGFLYNALEYLQKMFEELREPDTRHIGVGRLVSVIVIFIALAIIF
jgi:hypothetical protein